MNETMFPMPSCRFSICRFTLHLRNEYIPHMAQAQRGLPLNSKHPCKQIDAVFHREAHCYSEIHKTVFYKNMYLLEEDRDDLNYLVKRFIIKT